LFAKPHGVGKNRRVTSTSKYGNSNVAAGPTLMSQLSSLLIDGGTAADAAPQRRS
jgi:hypothetical protein